MRAAAEAPQAQVLKLKALAIEVPTPTKDDEENFFGSDFKRRRKTPVAPTDHS